MRTLGILALCLVSGCARVFAQEATPDPNAGTLVDCGAEKAVVFEDTTSKDGHFALGWTLRPNRKKELVDWSAYKRAESPAAMALTLMEKYPTNDDEPAKGDYLLVNGVLDLTAKKFAALPIKDPHFPGRNHHGVSVTWSEDRQDTRFAVVSNDDRFATVDLFLVHLTSNHVESIPLSPTADKAVADRKRDPKDYRNYVTTYELASDDSAEPGKKPPSEFQKDSVTIRFYTNIPKSDVNVDQGEITFALSKGTILNVTFDKK